jgi:putative FmdB family regulatory protein
MPIYEYRCEACGHELEAIQKFSDAPLTDCPTCGKNALKKLISAAGFQLKGSGWYQTDFKGKKTDTSSSDSAPAPDSGAKKTHGCGGCGGGGCAHG